MPQRQRQHRLGLRRRAHARPPSGTCSRRAAGRPPLVRSPPSVAPPRPRPAWPRSPRRTPPTRPAPARPAAAAPRPTAAAGAAPRCPARPGPPRSRPPRAARPGARRCSGFPHRSPPRPPPGPAGRCAAGSAPPTAPGSGAARRAVPTSAGRSLTLAQRPCCEPAHGRLVARGWWQSVAGRVPAVSVLIMVITPSGDAPKSAVSPAGLVHPAQGSRRHGDRDDPSAGRSASPRPARPTPAARGRGDRSQSPSFEHILIRTQVRAKVQLIC